MDYWILVLAFLAGLAIGIRPTPTPVETAFFAVSHCISYRFIIKNAAVRRSMRRCLIAQSRSMSKAPRPPSCAYPSSGLIAVRPPYKNTLRSQKSVPLHSTLKKCYAARSMAYIRPMTDSQPIDDREKKYPKQHEKWKLL